MKKHWLLTAALLVCSPALLAWDVVITMDRPDGQYKVGETATFTVKAVGDDVPDGKITADFSIDNGKVLEKRSFALKEGAVFSGTLDKPGFLKVSIRHRVAGKRIYKIKGAAFEPEKIVPGSECPADFKSWWDGELAAAKKSAGKVELKELPKYSGSGKNGSFKCYLVSVNVDGGKVYGFLTVPVSEKPVPAVVMIAAAGSDRSAPVVNQFSNRWAVLYLNVHDVDPTAADAAAFRKSIHTTYPRQNSGDKSKYFYHRVICGMNLLVDHLAALPEINGNQIGVMGVSQGGGLSLVLAATNKHIKAAAVAVPAFCDHFAAAQDRAPGWPKLIQRNVDGSAETAKYYDAANFCRLINVPVWMVVGYEDETCPPGSVYAAFNSIPGARKAIMPEVDKGHTGGTRSYGECVGRMRNFVLRSK